MRLDFTYTAEDFDEYWRIRWPEEARRRQLGPWIRSIVMLGIGVTAIFVIFSPKSPFYQDSQTGKWYLVYTLLKIILFFFGPAVVVSIIGRRRKSAIFLKSRVHLEQPQSLEISDEQIDLWNPLASTRYPWTSFVNWVESKDLFALRLTGKMGVIVIPKRATTDEQQNQLREIFKARIVSPTGGFPVTIPDDS